MSLPIFRSTASTFGGGDSQSVVTITKPAGTVEGDLLFAGVMGQGAPIALPTGWTRLSADINQWIGYKVAGSSEPSSYSWTFATAGTNYAGTMVAYDQVHTTEPISAFRMNPNTGTLVNVREWVAYPNSLLLVAKMQSNTTTVTAPTGYTLRASTGGAWAGKFSVAEANTPPSVGLIPAPASWTTGGSGDNFTVVLRGEGEVVTNATIAGSRTLANVGYNEATIEKPAGTVEGDTLLMTIWATEDFGTVTPPSGWTLHVNLGDGVTMEKCLIYSKVTGPSEPPMYAWAWTDTQTNADVYLFRIAYANGVRALSTYDSANVSGTDVALPSINAVTNDLLLSIAFISSARTATPASGFTENFDGNFDTLTDDTGSLMSTVCVEIASMYAASTGATGVKTVVWSSADTDRMGAFFAIKRGNYRPTAPTLLTPADLGIVAADGAAFTWTHNDPDADPQGAYAVRRKRVVV